MPRALQPPHWRLVATLLALATFLVFAGASVQAEGPAGRLPIDVEHECLEPVPDTVAVPVPLDDGDAVTLDVLVLLHGVSQQHAQAVMATAAQPYEPLAVTVAPRYADLGAHVPEQIDADELMATAKQRVGGERPAGVDIVYVLTASDLTLNGSGDVAGLADCIGGVRYPAHAFAVGEAHFDAATFGPITFYADVPAKIAAHELAHLLGAHHHYANCAETAAGPPGERAVTEASPCTLMINFLDVQALGLSTVNASVVRGHASSYARP